jgi:hypothetical protein
MEARGSVGFEWLYLDEELEVHIVGLGRGALGPLVPPAGFEVDTLRITAAALAPVRSQKETRRDLDGARDGVLTMAAAAAVGLSFFAAAASSYLVRLRLGKESGGAPRGNYIGSRRGVVRDARVLARLGFWAHSWSCFWARRMGALLFGLCSVVRLIMSGWAFGKTLYLSQHA